MRTTLSFAMLAVVGLLAGCTGSSPAIPMALAGLPVIQSAAARPDLPRLPGARPTLIAGLRAIAQRTDMAAPLTPSSLWESRRTSTWQAPSRLFADLPSAYDAQLLPTPSNVRLYFAAIPPRGSVPRLYQTTATGTGAWADPEKLTLPDQGAGAQAPDVATDGKGTWWMAYASAKQADVRLARSTDGANWQYVDRLADGTRPKLAVMPNGSLVLAWEQAGNVLVRRSADGATWQDVLTVPQAHEPALVAGSAGLLLATLDSSASRGSGVTWRRSADGIQWTAPATLAAPDFGSLQWLVTGSSTALYGASGTGKGQIDLVPVRLESK